MQLHARDAREIGIEPGGHAAARLLHGVKFGHWAIDSEVAPGVGYLIVVEFNDDGAALAGFRVHEVADEFHGYRLSSNLEVRIMLISICSRFSAQPPARNRSRQPASPCRADLKCFGGREFLARDFAAVESLPDHSVLEPGVAKHLDGGARSRG